MPSGIYLDIASSRRLAATTQFPASGRDSQPDPSRTTAKSVDTVISMGKAPRTRHTRLLSAFTYRRNTQIDAMRVGR